MATPRKLVGDLAQTSIGANISISGCTTTAGSPAIPTTGSLVGVTVGQNVTGTGIPAGATVLSVGSGTFSISANATASGSGIVIATGETQVIGLMDWKIDVKLKTPDATTTDDAAWESSLPSSKSWTATAAYCFYDGDPSQEAAILATINAPGTVTRWNFFPDSVNSDAAFYGNAYIDSLSFTAGVGKIVALNVTLKGTGPLTKASQTAPIVNANTISGFQAEV